MAYFYRKMKSPLGPLHLVSDGKALLVLTFDVNWPETKAVLGESFGELVARPCSVLKETERQLCEYFKGERKRFDIPVRLEGTEFQKKAWLALKSIPFGKTCSYQEQAMSIKKPKAVRAVGGANGKNPIAVILPCHRVIGKSGRLTGFTGGLSIKEYLLRHEAKVMGRVLN